MGDIAAQLRTMLVAGALGLVFAGAGAYVGFVMPAGHRPDLTGVPGLPGVPALPSLPPRPHRSDAPVRPLPDLPGRPTLPADDPWTPDDTPWTPATAVPGAPGVLLPPDLPDVPR
ncbi:hypothetical protein [Actinoplanes teichomyceticus]|uniref:Uncharacterized protein n=1 Tax=Actinoplanes teichomyceticus TaxID=1867 RepID=A0A561WKH3_ACTTI|nr:hypothetical protein [Actinoplanes teichomyceticus]TWG24367.1 hypothetical protein FHX34_102923 [Actinoplanes teichomyceticus]GIF12781.1 hypothetical protein Ate01nite_28130 [Actinoplanes teichomyceticus]